MNAPVKCIHQSEHRAARAIVETLFAILGIGLILGTLAANQPWFDRHFLPLLFISHRLYVLGETLARVAVAAFGAALALIARPAIGRYVARVSMRALAGDMARISLAIVLALGASELVLRITFPGAKSEPTLGEVPLRQLDGLLGWTLVPGRTASATVGGRRIEYAIDRAGYRVRSTDHPVDPERPAILFTGESIMVGFGMNWQESVPAQVEALLGMQSANLAVSGFANDQAYLRLSAELPHFRRPVAVVSLFMPGLFDRNLDDDRPYLGPELQWFAPVHRWRLGALAKFLVPYRSDEAIERGIVATRAVLRATANLAQARGAVALILVPQFGQETVAEQMLRRRILDETGLQYVRVELDPGWHIPGDSHPDARATAAMAMAVANRLKQMMAGDIAGDR